MSVIRRLSSRALVAVAVGLVAVVAALAVAALRGASTLPPSEPLDQAIAGALSSPPPAGLSAQITFSDNLLGSLGGAGGLGALGSLGGLGALAGLPFLSGATGRLWVAADGHARLELDAAGGDTEVTFDGTTLTAYDAATASAYQLSFPSGVSPPTPTQPASVPSLADIDAALAALGRFVDISSPTPDDVGGEPAYTVSVTPLHGGRLAASLSLSFDASTGLPLQLALDQSGSSSPLFELDLSDVSYAAVPASEVDFALPAGTKLTTLTLPSLAALAGVLSPASGAGPVGQALAFPLVAPATLDGLARGAVDLIGSGFSAGALVSYGSGAGGLIVLERAAADAAGGGTLSGLLDLLPSVSVGSVSGHELATGLGSVVVFQQDGVSYLLAGALDQADAQTAASALAAAAG